MSDGPTIKYGDMELTAYTYTMPLNVSREMLLDFRQIEPTPEELAERNERARLIHDKQRDERVRALAALAELRDKDPLTTALLDLHSCDTEALHGDECAGCDFTGCESEPPEWPCRTVLAIAKHHGIDMPRALPGRYYEGEFVPSDGRPLTYRPRWFTPTLDDD